MTRFCIPALILVGACTPERTDPLTAGSDSDTGVTGVTATTTASSTDGSGDGTATDGTADSSATATGGGGLACEGKVLQCGNGIDDDMDGLADDDDPECTGPCDDDEATFETGIPGDNVDCKQDCFFDGNSGQGDDGCLWDLKCDPENPGANINCEYSGGNNCGNEPPHQTERCIDFCSSLTPNGCDCFGCCAVQTPDGEVHVFLNSGGGCSLANLDACQSCTPSPDCGNPCVPEDCEVCFGEDAPPEGCDDPGCPDGVTPCGGSGETMDCPVGYFCLTGCCVNYVPPG